MKPEFWRDRLIAGLDDGARLFYIGLWQQADDDGWLRWTPDEIAADLYPYRAVELREAQVREWGDRLVALGRLTIRDCGHAVIPTLTKHQRRAGTPVTTIAREHRGACLQEQVAGPGARPKVAQHAEARGSTQERATGGEVRGGEGREGEVSARPSMNGSTPDNEPATTSRFVDAYKAYAAVTGAPPNLKQKRWIDDLCRDFDREFVALQMYDEPNSVERGFLGRLSKRLRAMKATT